MNFNEALQRAADLSKSRLMQLQEDIFLVRDLNGRIRVLLASPAHGPRPQKQFEDALKGLAQDVTAALGTYAYPRKELFLFRSELQSLSRPTATSAPILREDAGTSGRIAAVPAFGSDVYRLGFGLAKRGGVPLAGTGGDAMKMALRKMGIGGSMCSMSIGWASACGARAV